jgi:hypothetical protein
MGPPGLRNQTEFILAARALAPAQVAARLAEFI